MKPVNNLTDSEHAPAQRPMRSSEMPDLGSGERVRVVFASPDRDAGREDAQNEGCNV